MCITSGGDKCVFLKTERGKVVNIEKVLAMNDFL